MTTERWEAIARELGDYDLCDGSMVKANSFVPEDDLPGEWVRAEPAGKRIAELEQKAHDLQIVCDALQDKIRQLQDEMRIEREADEETCHHGVRRRSPCDWCNREAGGI